MGVAIVEVISLIGVWDAPAYTLAALIASLAPIIIILVEGRKYVEAGEREKAFLSGEDEPGYEPTRLGVAWGFREALRPVMDLLRRGHSGNLREYIMWLIVMAAGLVTVLLIWG